MSARSSSVAVCLTLLSLVLLSCFASAADVSATLPLLNSPSAFGVDPTSYLFSADAAGLNVTVASSVEASPSNNLTITASSFAQLGLGGAPIGFQRLGSAAESGAFAFGDGVFVQMANEKASEMNAKVYIAFPPLATTDASKTLAVLIYDAGSGSGVAAGVRILPAAQIAFNATSLVVSVSPSSTTNVQQRLHYLLVQDIRATGATTLTVNPGSSVTLPLASNAGKVNVVVMCNGKAALSLLSISAAAGSLVISAPTAGSTLAAPTGLKELSPCRLDLSAVRAGSSTQAALVSASLQFNFSNAITDGFDRSKAGFQMSDRQTDSQASRQQKKSHTHTKKIVRMRTGEQAVARRQLQQRAQQKRPTSNSSRARALCSVCFCPWSSLSLSAASVVFFCFSVSLLCLCVGSCLTFGWLISVLFPLLVSLHTSSSFL